MTPMQNKEPLERNLKRFALGTYCLLNDGRGSEVDIEIDREDGNVTLRCDGLGLSVYGKTFDSAMTKFLQQAEHFRKYYRETPDEKLVSSAIRYKEAFAWLYEK